jgi:hypothetical protein
VPGHSGDLVGDENLSRTDQLPDSHAVVARRCFGLRSSRALRRFSPSAASRRIQRLPAVILRFTFSPKVV